MNKLGSNLGFLKNKGSGWGNVKNQVGWVAKQDEYLRELFGEWRGLTAFLRHTLTDEELNEYRPYMRVLDLESYERSEDDLKLLEAFMIKSAPVLGSMSADELSNVSRCLNLEFLPSGTTVLEPGETALRFQFVLHGTIALWQYQSASEALGDESDGGGGSRGELPNTRRGTFEKNAEGEVEFKESVAGRPLRPGEKQLVLLNRRTRGQWHGSLTAKCWSAGARVEAYCCVMDLNEKAYAIALNAQRAAKEMKRVDFLCRVPVFSGAHVATLAEVAALMHEELLTVASVLLYQGDEASNVYVVAEGLVDAFKMTRRSSIGGGGGSVHSSGALTERSPVASNSSKKKRLSLRSLMTQQALIGSYGTTSIFGDRAMIRKAPQEMTVPLLTFIAHFPSTVTISTFFRSRVLVSVTVCTAKFHNFSQT